MEKIIEILGLTDKATEDEIVAAIADLKALASKTPAVDPEEAAIKKKIADSGGALNREQAIMAIQHQKDADKTVKKKGGKKNN